MLESFRDRFKLFHKKKKEVIREPKAKQIDDKVNVNAGADLLAKFQKEWMLNHEIAEENASKANAVFEFINKLRSQCEKQHEMFEQLNSQLVCLPKLSQSVKLLTHETEELGNCFEKVNSALANLEHIIEIQELHEKQIEERFQLALFKEKKLADLERLKLQFANDHVLKVSAYESRQQTILKERQETFREVFEEEMNYYKLHGRIERLPSDSKTIPLEEVELEDDFEALNDFLAEEATEDTVGQYAIESALVEAIEDEDS